MRKQSKNFTKKILCVLLAVAMIITSAPIQTRAAQTTANEIIEISVGETKPLKNSRFLSRTTWKSSDTDVVTVSSNGVITGVSVGTATVTGTTKSIFDWFGSDPTVKTYEIIVTEGQEEILTIYVGETTTLGVQSTSGTTTWESSDTDVATVTNDGVVTGVGEGTATITATTKSCGFSFWFFLCGGTTTTTTFEIKVIANGTEESEPDPETKTYTVTFETNGGSAVDSQTVEEGQLAIRPKDPVKEGHEFAGWYMDKELSAQYDFTTPVTGDITLYASWKETEIPPVVYTVTFESNGGSNVDPQSVESGSVAVKPEDPAREGHIFAGWYSDEELTTEYLFDTVVTSDIILYAKWNKEEAVPDEEPFVPSEDASDYYEEGLYSDEGNVENVYFNKDTYEEYFNNEIIVLLDEELSEETDKKVLELIEDSKIVGKNIYTQSYQIRLNSEKTYEELQAILEEVKEAGYEKSHLNRAIRLTVESSDVYYPNDILWNNIWSEDAVGPNWGMEAIKAPKVWKYKEYMEPITVGVLDTGFDIEHDDLKNVINVLNENTVGDEQDHGTHVSGTIGAEFDNEIGVCGVCPTAKLQGMVFSNIESEYVVSVGITELVKNGSRVINMSLGEYSDYIFAASQTDNIQLAYLIQEEIKAAATDLSYQLEKLLETYDFVICTCAGNTEGTYITKVDNSNSGYAEINFPDRETVSYVDSISMNRVTRNITQEDLNNEVPKETITKVVDAFWSNPLTAITNENVKSRIIVVGAAFLDENGNYTKSSFSNDGDRVDVIAPGEEIYSTVRDNTYGYKQGTSMASPHVAGLAGMLYALNPNLTGDQVKDIIIKGATTEVSNAEGKKMINTWDSYKIMCNDSLEEMGGITGTVVDENGDPIEGATITIGTALDDESNYETTTDADGKFTIECETGEQTYTVSKHGYVSYTGTETVVYDTTTIILDNIVLEKMSDMPDLEDPDEPEVFEGFAGGDGTTENPYQISTAVQLDAIRLDLDANYELINDIDLSKTTSWIPIGGTEGFSGILNGNDFKLLNLNITAVGRENDTSSTIRENSAEYAFGLFSLINENAVLKNIIMQNFTIKVTGCYADTGLLVGKSYGTITNCGAVGTVTGVIGGTNESNTDYTRTNTGGLVGDNIGTIQYSWTKGMDEEWYGGVLGGIAGCNAGEIEGCKTTNIFLKGDTSRNSVGLAGGIDGRNSGTINLCYSNVDVYAYANYGGAAAGGIAGANASGTVKYCFFEGNVSAKVVSSNYGALYGGIVGSNADSYGVGSKGKINNCLYTTCENVCRSTSSQRAGVVENNYTTVEEGQYIIDAINEALSNIHNFE